MTNRTEAPALIVLVLTLDDADLIAQAMEDDETPITYLHEEGGIFIPEVDDPAHEVECPEHWLWLYGIEG